MEDSSSPTNLIEPRIEQLSGSRDFDSQELVLVFYGLTNLKGDQLWRLSTKCLLALSRVVDVASFNLVLCLCYSLVKA